MAIAVIGLLLAITIIILIFVCCKRWRNSTGNKRIATECTELFCCCCGGGGGGGGGGGKGYTDRETESHELAMTSNPHYEKTKGKDSRSHSPEETSEYNVLRHPEPEGSRVSPYASSAAPHYDTLEERTRAAQPEAIYDYPKSSGEEKTE